MCHQVVALKVLSSLLMPNFTNFFHDVEGWNIRHVLGDSYSSLSHEKHIGRQRFLGQLIEKSLVTDCAELCQFLRKSFFVSFGSLFVLLLLLLRHFCHSLAITRTTSVTLIPGYFIEITFRYSFPNRTEVVM